MVTTAMALKMLIVRGRHLAGCGYYSQLPKSRHPSLHYLQKMEWLGAPFRLTSLLNRFLLVEPKLFGEPCWLRSLGKSSAPCSKRKAQGRMEQLLSINLPFPAKRKMLIMPTPENKKTAELTLYSWYELCQTYCKFFLNCFYICMIDIDILIEYVCVCIFLYVYMCVCMCIYMKILYNHQEEYFKYRFLFTSIRYGFHSKLQIVILADNNKNP